MKTIPMISVRDFVVFPGTTSTFIIGRPFTIATLKKALESFGGQVVVTAQRSVEMNERPSADDLFTMGCLCRIVQHIEFPDGMMNVVMEADTKFKFHKINDVDDIRYCEGELWESNPPKYKLSSQVRSELIEKISTQKKEWEMDIGKAIEKLRTIKEGYPFLMTVAGLIMLRRPIRKTRTLEEIKNGVFLFDVLTEQEKKKINGNLAYIQEILEATEEQHVLAKIEALL